MPLPFWPQNGGTLIHLAILPVIDSFDSFLPKGGGGQMLSNFNFETRFGILSSRLNFLTQNERQLKTLFSGYPIVFPKLQSLCISPVFKTSSSFSA